MATEKQIAANRKNARKSTGPKTRIGKRRASGNAHRYGLSIHLISRQDSETVESLARSIACSRTDEGVLHYARAAARAHLNLARIRQVKLDIIESVCRFGALKPAPRFRSFEAEIAYLKRQAFNKSFSWPERVDPLGPMPADEAARMAEAVRRLLPELEKMHRYERRSITTRDRALHAMIERDRKNARDQDTILQNEPNI